MRDLSKLVTGSMIAGAALLVAACGSNEDASVNNTALNVEETMPVTNDMTGIDAMNGTDANLGAMDSTNTGTTTDTTVTNGADTTTTTTTTNTTTTNGM